MYHITDTQLDNLFASIWVSERALNRVRKEDVSDYDHVQFSIYLQHRAVFDEDMQILLDLDMVDMYEEWKEAHSYLK